ncbi:MAG: fasciclin domain-containing protein [Bacteroidota bacterium]
MKPPQIRTYFLLSVLFFAVWPSLIAQSSALTPVSTDLLLTADKTIAEATLASADHQTLYAAVKAADLEKTLETSGPFTVFAPSDRAFSRFSTEELKNLFKSENRRKLKALLTYHIVAGNLTASKILLAMCRGNGKAIFTTIQGNKITATMQGTDIILTDSLGNSAKIITADSSLRNGVIHEIDSVILPSRI